MRRPRATRWITRRAASTSGSSGNGSRSRALLRFRRPVRLVLDAERFHLGHLLAPLRLLLVATAPVGDLLPLGGRAVERLLGRLPLGQRLGDLERELALVLVGGRDDRIGNQEREGRLDGVEVLVGIGERLAEDRRAQV